MLPNPFGSFGCFRLAMVSSFCMCMLLRRRNGKMGAEKTASENLFACAGCPKVIQYVLCEIASSFRSVICVSRFSVGAGSRFLLRVIVKRFSDFFSGLSSGLQNTGKAFHKYPIWCEAALWEQMAWDAGSGCRLQSADLCRLRSHRYWESGSVLPFYFHPVKSVFFENFSV